MKTISTLTKRPVFFIRPLIPGFVAASLTLFACDSGGSENQDMGADGGGLPPGLDSGADEGALPGETGEGSGDSGGDGAGPSSNEGGEGTAPSGSPEGGSDPSGSDGDGSGGEGSSNKDSSGDGGSGGDSKSDDDDSDGDDGDDDSEIRFDVEFPDGGALPGGRTKLKHSYIWIANSGQGSISKIDTQTMEEKGRYRTAASANNPSRSSVNLNGDVAVAGRAGGITKIIADPEKCEDKDGSGTIETSTDSTMLAWGADECVAWHTPTPHYAAQRAVAWTQGEYDPETDTYSGQDLWIASTAHAGEARLYDGETGAEIAIVTLTAGDMQPGANLAGGAYGGAVDSAGNFWWTNNGGNYLGRASLKTLDGIGYPKTHSSYGITAGGHGYIWTCYGTIGRFNPATESWDLVDGDMGRPDVLTSSHYGGCMVDADGILWHSGRLPGGSWGIFGLDVETMSPTTSIELPAHSHGISIDFDGYVWGIPINGSVAYRVDTKAKTYETFSGLVSAYTYSDMTGFALSSTVGPGVG